MTQATHTERLTPHGNISVVTHRLLALLSQGKVGDIIPLDRLNEVAQCDCGTGGKGYQNRLTAQRLAKVHHNLNWDWDRDAKGLRCLDCEGSLDLVSHKTRTMRRIARHNVLTLNNANPQTPQERSQVYANLAIHGSIHQALKPGAVAALEKHQATSPADYITPMLARLKPVEPKPANV